MKLTSALFLITGIIIFSFVSAPAQYISSTTASAGLPTIYPGQLTESIIRVEIEVDSFPVTLTDMIFNLNGTTQPLIDVVNAHLWQYNDTSELNTNFGLYIGTYSNPGTGNFSFLTTPNANYSGMASYSGMTVLKKNYFWLALDISPNTPVCDTIDGEFISLIADLTVQTPAISAPSGFKVVGICPTALQDHILTSSITVFPQPCHGELTIAVEGAANDNFALELFNTTGKKITTLYDGPFHESASEIKFDFSEYPAGTYYLKTVSNKSVATSKIIKF